MLYTATKSTIYVKSKHSFVVLTCRLKVWGEYSTVSIPRQKVPSIFSVSRQLNRPNIFWEAVVWIGDTAETFKPLLGTL